MPEHVIEIAPTELAVPSLARKLRVAAYCRISTSHEEQQSSLENQINFYTDYIRSHPNWTLVAVYYDTASGLRANRRLGYQQLIWDCDKGKVDLILVKSLSRFGRNALETIKQVRRLKEMNIGIYVEGSCFSTLTVDDLLIAQLAAVDQEESRARSENIKFGIRHRMKSGKTILNHSQFLGYTKGPDGKLEIVPEEAEIVHKIFELYIQGNGVRKIKKYLESHKNSQANEPFRNVRPQMYRCRNMYQIQAIRLDRSANKIPGFDDRKNVSEVVFYSCQIHFIQAEEIRTVAINLCLLYKINNSAGNKLSVQIHMAEQVRRV